MINNGIQKNVIVIRNTGSRFFEQAYFILRPAAEQCRESDIVAEANRIVARAEEMQKEPRLSHKRAFFARCSGLVACAAGFVCGLLVSLCVILLR